jgi:hypothetical protein
VKSARKDGHTAVSAGDDERLLKLSRTALKRLNAGAQKQHAHAGAGGPIPKLWRQHLHGFDVSGALRDRRRRANETRTEKQGGTGRVRYQPTSAKATVVTGASASS